MGATALASASPALGAQVPAASTVHATLVTSSPSGGTATSAPLRVRNPAQYKQALTAANERYAKWASAHSSPAASAFGPLTAIPNLTKPGMDASVDGGGLTPPDTTGAIGPSNYFEFVNSQVAVYSRTLASPLATTPEDTFTGSTSTCDGQIKWDQQAQRWEYYSLDCAAATTSQGYTFGFSKSASPTPLPTASSAGNWCRYHVGTGSDLMDYGKLGNSNGYLLIGANEFDMTTSGYVGSPITVWPKPPTGVVSTCPSESGWIYNPSSSTEFTPEPANEFPGSNTGLVVATNPDQQHLRVFTLTPPATAGNPPVLTDKGNVTVPAFSQPASVPQPGTSDTIDSSDTRLTQATAAIDPTQGTYTIWTQHTVAGASGGPSVVRWYEIKPGATTPVQTGTIADSGLFAFNGAIAPDGQGNAAAINYNVGSSTVQAQVRASDHLPGTAAGSMANETTLGTSSGVNEDFSCSPCRWGDYAGASTDPTCRANVWGTNELNGATNPGVATWKTQNFRLGLDECPTASFTVTPTSPTHGSPASFDGTASSDPDGSISSYAWKFGDGTTGTGATISHTYAAAGTYRAILTVTDSSGLTGSITKTITVG